MSKRFVRWVSGISFTAGLYAGYRLSLIPGLRTYKLLNLAGLLYTLLGMLVLSEILATEQWKDLCVKRVAPAIYYIQSIFPLGAIVGGLASLVVTSLIMHKASSSAKVFFFWFGFCGWSLFVGMFFQELVVWPSLHFIRKNVEMRWRLLGFFLVLGGLVAQLIAASLDLNP